MNTEVIAQQAESESASRLRRVAETINQHPAAVLVGISALYFAITGVLAHLKLLWLDEFITFYISKLGHVSAIWKALGNGADPNPPLTYVLVLLARRIFGESEFALRLPAIVASWAGIVALYVFLKRRITPLYAAAGALFFMATAAFDYSFESRSYALLLGFTALSLVAWRGSIEGSHKVLGAVALALALAADLSSNYFGVLAFFPIAAGELLRDIRLRRIEWRVWAALAAAASVLFFYLPLINKSVATFSPYAWNKVEVGAIADSYLEMVEVILWPALALLAIGVIVYFKSKGSRGTRVMPPHESLAAFMLMLFPFLGYAIARIHGGMLSPRFVIPMCYGFAIAVVATAFRLFRGRVLPGFAVLALLFAWVVAREGVVARMYHDQRLALDRVIDTLPRASTIAVPDSLLVLPLYRYAPREIASHIVFPVDFSAIRQYKKEDSPEQNLWNGRHGIYPVPILSLQEFEATTPDYLIAATSRNWLVRELAAEGKPVQVLPIFTDSKDIQGFTPLCHGPVWFFEGSGGNSALAANARRGNMGGVRAQNR